jgi:hypothetical protein
LRVVAFVACAPPVVFVLGLVGEFDSPTADGGYRVYHRFAYLGDRLPLIPHEGQRKGNRGYGENEGG